MWCQPCQGPVAWLLSPHRQPQCPQRGLHPSLCVSPLLLPLQTTARMRKRCWEPATAARVSVILQVLPSPRMPSLQGIPVRIFHPDLSKGNVKPSNSRPFSLQLNPTAPARMGCGCQDTTMPLALLGEGRSPQEDLTNGCWEKCRRETSSVAQGRRREEKYQQQQRGGCGRSNGMQSSGWDADRTSV